jgi:S-adenosylmethionine decarboxylase
MDVRSSTPQSMIVGTEWLIEAEGCSAERLRDEELLRRLFAQVVDDLGLKTLGDPLWHRFGGEAGVTGLVMLTESHLTCHTYPEHGLATINLYCCRERPEWPWTSMLEELLCAEKVSVVRIERGTREMPEQLSAGGEA